MRLFTHCRRLILSIFLIFLFYPRRIDMVMRVK